MNEEADTQEQPEYDTNAKPWLDLIKDAEKCFELYQEKCDSIDKLYANIEHLAKGAADREFQIFWANLEVLKPSIYARPPVPVVVPRFKKRKPIVLKAADVLERTISSALELDEFDLTMKAARDDLATNARGALWLRYEASEGAQGVDERVVLESLERRDFLHDPARKWKEVEWVARRSYITRKQGVARFGDEFLKAEFSEQKNDKEDAYKGEKKAAVWEIWHRTEQVVVWVSPGMQSVLDIQPPFLELQGFFPCPMPAYGTVQRGSLKPVPDFLYYKDQVEEINELTARISALAEALRMKGFYPGGAEDVAAAIEAAMKSQDNNALLIPVANFGALGGTTLKDSIIWLPVSEVAETVRGLVELRRQLIDDVYQITGISDIMRGTTQANETLGAQQLKSQYGSVRIRDRQEELIRLARDAIAIAGEIIAENFAPQTIRQMSQEDELPDAAQVQQANMPPEQMQGVVTFDAVVKLLRSQRLRPFVLDIETDSTIQPDENAAKERANEFLTAVGGFIQQALPMVQALPEAAPLAAELLKYTANQYRAGRELSGVIDEFAEMVKQKASQPQDQGPNPDEMKLQIEQQRAQTDAQNAERDAQVRMMEAQAKQEMEAQEFQRDMEKMRFDMQLASEVHAMQMDKMRADIDKVHAEIMRINVQAQAASQPKPEQPNG